MLVALLANEPESDDVGRQFAAWAEAGIELHAPSLARYEIANALTRKTAHGEIAEEDLASVWAGLDALPIHYDALTDGAAVMRSRSNWSGAAPSTPPTSHSRTESEPSCGRSTDRSLATPRPAAMP